MFMAKKLYLGTLWMDLTEIKIEKTALKKRVNLVILPICNIFLEVIYSKLKNLAKIPKSQTGAGSDLMLGPRGHIWAIENYHNGQNYFGHIAFSLGWDRQGLLK